MARWTEQADKELRIKNNFLSTTIIIMSMNDLIHWPSARHHPERTLLKEPMCSEQNNLGGFEFLNFLKFCCLTQENK